MSVLHAAQRLGVWSRQGVDEMGARVIRQPADAPTKTLPALPFRQAGPERAKPLRSSNVNPH